MAPVSSIDPFSVESLRDPRPWHGQLREAGPVVWLERYGIWAMARYEQVHAVLLDWETFCSSAGVGLSNFRTEQPWRRPSLLLEADPPEHSRARKAINRALSPRTVRELRAEFDQRAAALATDLMRDKRGDVDGVRDKRGDVDGVREIAEAFPLAVFPAAIGLPPDDGQTSEALLAYGNLAFNAFGPRNELTRQAAADAGQAIEWITARCERSALIPGALAAKVYECADEGLVTEEEAGLLVRSLLTAGVDTTVVALEQALYGLATHPEQWKLLRDDPSLAGPAFEESVRWGSPVQTFFRTATREVTVAGTTIKPDEKVLLFLAAANRDPRRFNDPDQFDIRRKAAGHVGFGAGIHLCVGAAFARMEGEALLQALARNITALEPAGDPVPRLNNTLCGFSSLPLRLSLWRSTAGPRRPSTSTTVSRPTIPGPTGRRTRPSTPRRSCGR
jgi:4-methoxybenzoate monooxygenase (O-demethylating)